MNGATIFQDSITDADYDGFNCLEFAANAHDIEIYGGNWTGQHVTGWTNAQMAAIAMGLSNCNNINIHDCTFENLVGFSVQSRGGTTITVSDCNFINCGNGLNVTATGATLTGNYFEYSEGIESAGTNTLIENNTFNPALAGAISAGGDVGVTMHTGMIVRNNHILSVIGGSAIGIITADGLSGAIVELNDIANCDIGIDVAVSTGYTSVTENTTIRQNTIVNCTHGFELLDWGSRLTGTVIDNNIVHPAGTFGLLNYNPDVTFTNNDFRGSGSNKDVVLQASSAGCTFAASNLYTTIQDNR